MIKIAIKQLEELKKYYGSICTSLFEQIKSLKQNNSCIATELANLFPQKKQLMELLTGEKKTLVKFIKHYKTLLPTAEDGKNKDKITEFKKLFNYETFAPIHRNNILSLIGVGTCPYCDTEKVREYKDTSGSSKIDGACDHYFPKSIYPIVALSFFNFIPVCHSCNSQHKGIKDFYIDEHVYPYQEEFGEDAVFIIEKGYGNFIEDDETNLNFLINITGKMQSKIWNKIKNNLDTFDIVERYNTDDLRYHAKALFNKARRYTNESIDEYLALKIYSDSEKQLMDIIHKKLFGKYEFHKKFLNDIMGQWSDTNYSKLALVLKQA